MGTISQVRVGYGTTGTAMRVHLVIHFTLLSGFAPVHLCSPYILCLSKFQRQLRENETKMRDRWEETENARHENSAQRELQGVENAGLENNAQKTGR